MAVSAIDWREIEISVIGGDRRHIYLLDELAATGAGLRAFGLPPKLLPAGTEVCATLAAALANDVVILPLSGVDAAGRIAAPLAEQEICIKRNDLLCLKTQALVLTGKCQPPFAALLAARCRVDGKAVVIQDLSQNERLTVANAVPTAEGAILLALQETKITLHGSNCLVLGYGRCAKVLAERLRALNAVVTVAARRAEQLMWAEAAGCSTLLWSEWQSAGELRQADLIFNTVPAPVITAEVLQQTQAEVVVIDLASAPGGTDFAAARALGRKAILAPGLPGKTAPQTAGVILARCISSLVDQWLAGQLTLRFEQQMAGRC